MTTTTPTNGDPESSTKGDGEQRAGGGKTPRSETQYPYFGMQTGIDIVEAVRRAGGNDGANADVMREMGVTKTTDRKWAYGIPAAIQFGLVERVGRGDDGRIKLTELAMRIALPATPEERQVAIVAAFRQPDLYAKLLEKHAGHPLPSKDGLKNVLLREYGIVESMAPNAADAYLESLKTAGLVGTNNNVLAAPGAPTPTGDKDKTPEDPPAPPGMKNIAVPTDFIAHAFPLRRDLTVTIPLPATLTKRDVDRLQKWMGTLIFDEEENS